jgi:hypothetical protein
MGAEEAVMVGGRLGILGLVVTGAWARVCRAIEEVG